MGKTRYIWNSLRAMAKESTLRWKKTAIGSIMRSRSVFRRSFCIRQAIGQLLEYSYWPGSNQADRLIVVGEPELDSDAREYLEMLRNEFGLPIHYQQFDMKSETLKDCPI